MDAINQIAKIFGRDVTWGCDKPARMQNFDVEAYMGRWYEIRASKPNMKQNHFMDCAFLEYTDLDVETNEFMVLEHAEVKGLPEIFMYGEGDFSDQGHGRVEYVVGGRVQNFDESNYWVVDTDYENYSLMYHCDERQFQPELWILSRTPTIELDYLNELKDKATELLPNYYWGLDKHVKQTHCQYQKREEEKAEKAAKEAENGDDKPDDKPEKKSK